MLRDKIKTYKSKRLLARRFTCDVCDHCRFVLRAATAGKQPNRLNVYAGRVPNAAVSPWSAMMLDQLLKRPEARFALRANETLNCLPRHDEGRSYHQPPHSSKKAVVSTSNAGLSTGEADKARHRRTTIRPESLAFDTARDVLPFNAAATCPSSSISNAAERATFDAELAPELLGSAGSCAGTRTAEYASWIFSTPCRAFSYSRTHRNSVCLQRC